MDLRRAGAIHKRTGKERAREQEKMNLKINVRQEAKLGKIRRTADVQCDKLYVISFNIKSLLTDCRENICHCIYIKANVQHMANKKSSHCIQCIRRCNNNK